MDGKGPAPGASWDLWIVKHPGLSRRHWQKILCVQALHPSGPCPPHSPPPFPASEALFFSLLTNWLFPLVHMAEQSCQFSRLMSLLGQRATQPNRHDFGVQIPEEGTPWTQMASITVKIQRWGTGSFWMRGFSANRNHTCQL